MACLDFSKLLEKKNIVKYPLNKHTLRKDQQRTSSDYLMMLMQYFFAYVVGTHLNCLNNIHFFVKAIQIRTHNIHGLTVRLKGYVR